VKQKLLVILKLIGWFVWFSVGLFFIVAAAGLGAGALVPGSSAFIGIATMFFGAMLLVFSEIGKTMIGKMRIVLEDLQRAFKKAADSVEDQAKD
jgi:hypothetical protein